MPHRTSRLQVRSRLARLGAATMLLFAFGSGAAFAHAPRLVPDHLRPVSAGAGVAAISDSSDVAAVVGRFHAALAAGDSATALALLADDVVIVESGGVETRDDYRAHHLPADIRFARAVPSQRGPLAVRVQGAVAWASGTSVTQGDYNGRAVNSVGAELMVLSRDRGTWKIRAIHWSSRARRPQ